MIISPTDNPEGYVQAVYPDFAERLKRAHTHIEAQVQAQAQLQPERSPNGIRAHLWVKLLCEKVLEVNHA